MRRAGERRRWLRLPRARPGRPPRPSGGSWGRARGARFAGRTSRPDCPTTGTTVKGRRVNRRLVLRARRLEEASEQQEVAVRVAEVRLVRPVRRGGAEVLEPASRGQGGRKDPS